MYLNRYIHSENAVIFLLHYEEPSALWTAEMEHFVPQCMKYPFLCTHSNTNTCDHSEFKAVINGQRAELPQSRRAQSSNVYSKAKKHPCLWIPRWYDCDICASIFIMDHMGLSQNMLWCQISWHSLRQDGLQYVHTATIYGCHFSMESLILLKFKHSSLLKESDDNP